MAAVRFYLPSTGTPAVSPAYDSGWEDQSIAARLSAVTSRISSAMTQVDFTDADATLKDILFRQYVTQQLPAQTITAQTIKFQMRGLEGHANNNMFIRVNIRSWNGVSTFQTILSMANCPLELTTTIMNRTLSTTSTEVTIGENDRIVIEIGTSGDPGSGRAHTSSLSIGDDHATTDLGENNTDTAAYNPWLEFASLQLTAAQRRVFVTS